MNIRRAGVDDAELLARLNVPVQQIHYEARPDLYKPAAVTAELIADFHGRLAREDTGVFIGELAGEPIGYMVTQIAERDENPYSYATRTLIVDQLSINPDQRSKGYGEALIQAAFDLARTLGIERVVVGVWTFNKRAIAFYERQGFTARDQRMEVRLEKAFTIHMDGDWMLTE